MSGEHKMSLPELFGIFFYVGLFTIGGGLVAITLMYQPVVEAGLISSALFYNMVAISESTPGPIGINMATYVGYELYGPIGGILTTAGTVLPSLIIIIIIAKYFAQMQTNKLVQAAFSGLRPAVSGMIAVAAAQVLEITLINIPSFEETGNIAGLFQPRCIIFYVLALAVLFKTKIHPILIIFAGAVFGILFL